MRGGIFTGHEPVPYGDDDLAREFGTTHALGHLSDVIKRNTSLTNLQSNVFVWTGSVTG